MFIVYFGFGLFCYFYFYHKTRDALNPFGASLIVYLSMFALSTLELSEHQDEMLIRTQLLVIISAVVIFFVGYVYVFNHGHMLRNTDNQPIVTQNYKYLLFIVVVISILSVIYLIVSRGFNLQIDLNSSGALNARKGEVSGILYANAGIAGYIAMVFPYSIVFVFYDFLFDKSNTVFIRFLELIYCSISVLYTLFVLASRGTLLLPALGVLYLLNKKYHFKPQIVGLVLLLIVVLFSIYMELRIIPESAVFSGTPIKNRTFNAIYNYFAIGFNNLNMLVKDGSPMSGIKFSFISISKALGIYDINSLKMYKTLFFNGFPFIYGFYHDLGVLGVVLYPTLIYTFIGKLYIESREKHPECILLLAMYGKAIFILAFGNYFFGSFSGSVQYYACICLLIGGYCFRQFPKIPMLAHRRITIRRLPMR